MALAFPLPISTQLLQITPQPPPVTPRWSDLPELPLATITKLLLPVYRDLLSFAAVCRSWRALLRSLSPSLLPSLPPLLLLAPSLRLHSPSLLPPPPPPPSSFVPPLLLPVYSSSSSYRCLSSSHGQLLLIPSPGTVPLRLLIVDVVTGTRTDLPPIPADHERFSYYYASLTAPVSSPSARLLLFFSKFAFLSCRVSDNDGIWTRHCYHPGVSFINRVVPCKNRLFGLNDSAGLVEIEFSSDDQTNAARVSKVVRPPCAPSSFDRWHFGPQLVSGSDQLLLVLFTFDNETTSFRLDSQAHDTEIKVYGLDWRNMEWVEVKQLPNRAIFIDCAGKVPVLCEKPERWGGEGNCVYVTGPKFDRWMVCSLDEQKVRRMRPAVLDVPTSSWPSPIWVYPSLFY